MRNVFASVAAVVAVLALSACGGDSSPEQQINVPTETQASLDKAQFIAQADSICAEANASIEQFAAAGQGVTEADQIAQLRQGVVDQINELGPPSEDRTTLDQFLNAMTAQVSAGEKIGLASERGEDTSQFETELDTAKSEAETAASTYGFKECGSPISSSSTSSSTAGGTADTGGTVTPTAPSTPAPSDTPDSGGTSGGTGGATGGGDTGSGAPDSSGGTGAPSGGVGPG
jgi:predicted small lipoprotein YifL